MPKPATHAEHLARMIPASAGANGMGRRGFLRAAALTGLAASSPALLAACGDGGSGGGGDSKTVTLGSNEKGTGFAKQREAEAADFEEQTGIKVAINAVDHNTFQENISTYLQGNSDDVFSWFAGYRMRFFAEQGLIGDISDTFPVDGLPESFRTQATADDGNQYFMPQNYYPWAVFYRKSLWAERGYEEPKTYDELTALATQMQADGITPFAFGESDGWPAMGTFDMLNMRINGYQYHIDLMKHEESWDSPKTKAVFETFRELLPFHQPAANGRTWQEAAQSLLKKESGMQTLGTFINEQFGEEQDDLDFFTFPEIDSNIGADALDAPIDGWCMSAKARNEANAKELLKYLGSADAANAANTAEVVIIAANDNASTDPYTDLQKKSVEVVSKAKNLAQFLDRDTRPDFASTVMIPSLKNFVNDPSDVDGLLKNIESQAKTLFV